MVKITRLSLSIINKAKLRRLILGLTARHLSLHMNHGESYVSKIEDPNQPNQYIPHDYPILAEELNWTSHDLLPPDDEPVSDGTKVDKAVLSLSDPDDMRLVINGLIEYGFFNEPKGLDAVAKHLYIDGKTEEEVLANVLEDMTEKGALFFSGVLYQQPL